MELTTIYLTFDKADFSRNNEFFNFFLINSDGTELLYKQHTKIKTLPIFLTQINQNHHQPQIVIWEDPQHLLPFAKETFLYQLKPDFDKNLNIKNPLETHEMIHALWRFELNFEITRTQKFKVYPKDFTKTMLASSAFLLKDLHQNLLENYCF